MFREDLSQAKLFYYANKFKIDEIAKGTLDLQSFSKIYTLIKEDIRKKNLKDTSK